MIWNFYTSLYVLIILIKIIFFRLFRRSQHDWTRCSRYVRNTSLKIYKIRANGSYWWLFFPFYFSLSGSARRQNVYFTYSRFMTTSSWFRLQKLSFGFIKTCKVSTLLLIFCLIFLYVNISIQCKACSCLHKNNQ